MPRSPQKAADSGYSALVLDRSRWLTRANGMTLIRLIAAPVLAVAISADASLAATAVFTLAVATDVADGIVARRFGEASALGRLLDHTTDAIFVSVGTAALACAGELPVLLPTLIAASFVQYALDSRNPQADGPRPSSLGRWNGIAYFVVLAVPIVRDTLGLAWPDRTFVTLLGWLLVVSTLVSIADRLRFSLRR
ncbi:MAG: CDP-alcohol phosphatidyltransferase family protein [Myxococcota bacterium]